MKQLILIATILFPLIGTAQHTQGEVIYTEVTYIKKFINWDEIPEDRARRMKEFMPDSVANQKQLLFTADETVYKTLQNETQQAEYGSEGGGHRMMFGRRGANDIVYQGIKADTMLEFKESMGKEFLIQDSRKQYAWKMTKEKVIIQGYPCIKAMHVDSTDTLMAWFTPAIPVSSGPGTIGGLPGMVLQISAKGGRYILTASQVNIRSIEAGEIEMPKKGKKMTRTEFDELMRKKEEEMREMYGGKGRKGYHYFHH